MFGFSAFAEQPLGDADAAVAGVASVPVGAIGSSALGAHAIGRGATEGSGGTDVTATVTSNTLTITAPTATASGATQGNASAASNTITLTAPVVSVNTGAVVTVDAGKASQTFAVTVVNDGGGNKYYIDGVKQASLSLHEEGTYRFDVSASSVGGHPFNFSTTSDGTHNSGSAYTTGVTTVGTAGQAGAYLEIVVTTSTPDLYYYCSYHSGMGGAVAFSEQFSQVPFFVILSPQTSSATGGAITQVQANTVSLTAAEASATAGAIATFADTIEVGLTAPITSVITGVIVTTTASTISITAPVISENVTAGATLTTISLTAPSSSVTGGSLVTVSDLPTVAISAPNSTGAASAPPITITAPTITITAPITTAANRATLVFPTTFTVSGSGFASGVLGDWTVNSYSTADTYYIDWDRQFAWVVFYGKRDSDSTNQLYNATWSFDSAGNLTLLYIATFLSWASGVTAGVVRGGGFIHGDLETHPSLNGDVQLYTPLIAQNASGTYQGTYLYCNARALTETTEHFSYSDSNSLTTSTFSLGQVSTSATDTELVAPGGTWPAGAVTLPWHGDMHDSVSTARENLLIWSYKKGSYWYLKGVSEDGTLMLSEQSTSLANHKVACERLNDPTLTTVYDSGFSYFNHCVGPTLLSTSNNLHKWWHDSSAAYKEKAAKALRLTETVLHDTNSTATVTAPTITLSSPIATAIIPDIIATVSVPAITVSNADSVVTGGALVTVGDLPTVAISAPASSVSVAVQLVAPTITVTAPVPGASVSDTVTVTSNTVTVAAPVVTATGGLVTTVTSNSITTTAPVSSAVVNTTQNLVAGTITITPPVSTVSVGATVNAPTVSVTAPSVSENVADFPETLPTISITPPSSIATGGALTSVTASSISISPTANTVVNIEVAVAASTISVTAPATTVITFFTLLGTGASSASATASASAKTVANLENLSITSESASVGTATHVNPVTGSSESVASSNSYGIQQQYFNTNFLSPERTVFVPADKLREVFIDTEEKRITLILADLSRIIKVAA